MTIGVQLQQEKVELNKEDIFVQDLIDAARKGKLEFEASERDIDITDAKGLNAAMHLGADSPINMHLCEILVKRGALWEDFAYGAALSGNKSNAEVFLVKALEGKQSTDANIVYECVVFFAQKGGHPNIAEDFSKKIVKRVVTEEAKQFFEAMQELIQQPVSAYKDPNNPIIVSPKKTLLFSGKSEGRRMELAEQTDQQVLQTSNKTLARGIHKSNKGFNYVL